MCRIKTNILEQLSTGVVSLILPDVISFVQYIFYYIIGIHAIKCHETRDMNDAL